MLYIPKKEFLIVFAIVFIVGVLEGFMIFSLMAPEVTHYMQDKIESAIMEQGKLKTLINHDPECRPVVNYIKSKNLYD